MAQPFTMYYLNRIAKQTSRVSLLVLVIVIGLVGYSAQASSTKSDCAELPKLMRDLQKAQKAVAESLIQNHDMMSETLSSYSETVLESQGKAFKVIARNMSKASDGFKARADKATRHTTLIYDNTSEIISLIETCIGQ